jgi:hypothetical protein
MVALITPTAKLSKVLDYNEKKVAQDKAELIHTGNFLQEKDRMTYEQKLERFSRLHELNDRAQVKTLHITLNFDSSEKLSDDQLTAIADRYMQGLHMEDQPYLVYRHEDAGHPHIHIVTSLIQPDGIRINTDKMGKNLSEPTRKAIEKEFDLVPAQGKKQQTQQKYRDGETQKVIYGTETDTQEAMRKILEKVSRDYRFAYLTEYNAILRQYNVYANIGSPQSNTRKHGGLLYQALDEKGNKVGRPLKASQFPTKPTLANLREKMEQNKKDREKDLPSLRQKIDWALMQNAGSLRDFISDLQQESVAIIVHQDQQHVYGFTYVDNQNKTAINGADLGKAYNAGAILQSIQGQNQGPSKSQQQAQAQQQTSTRDLSPASGFNAKVPQFLSTLLQPESNFGTSPHELDEDQEIKKRRRR